MPNFLDILDTFLPHSLASLVHSIFVLIFSLCFLGFRSSCIGFSCPFKLTSIKPLWYGHIAFTFAHVCLKSFLLWENYLVCFLWFMFSVLHTISPYSTITTCHSFNRPIDWSQVWRHLWCSLEGTPRLTMSHWSNYLW